ncbi:GNAT family N-acetyltransferase [Microlunatus sp. Y2014]|uniref:GNAT family N-acetyltransferase n=1 Tax=Microlunatus sp. Y2014 TaxID=3418488 RepID=UPI003DA7A14E
MTNERSSGPELITRRLGADDRTASDVLSAEAFGSKPDPDRPWPLPGSTPYGTFERQGAAELLVAKAVARHYDSHFHGRLVPTCGLASVTVGAEQRGRGLLRRTLLPALTESREAGEVIATLFPTAPGIYRPFGFEVINTQTRLEFPSAELAEVAAPDAELVQVRRAGVEDAAAIADCYARWATQQNGPLSRRGASFPDGPEAMVREATGVWLAVEQGVVTGFCSWHRGTAYGPDAVATVDDLVAATPGAEAALINVLGSFRAVLGKVSLRSSGTDATQWHRRGAPGSPGWTTAYMLAVLDVPGAFAMLAPPPSLSGSWSVTVRGRTGVDITGDYRVTADAGRCEVVPGEAGGPVFTPGGLAAWWSGAAGPAELRLGGALSGTDAYDADLAALIGIRPVRVLDHF